MEAHELINREKRKVSIHFNNMLDMIDVINNPDVYFSEPRMANAKRTNYDIYRGIIGQYDHSGGDWFGIHGRSTKELLNLSIDGDHILYENFLSKMVSDLNIEIQVSDQFNIISKRKRKKIKGDFGNEVDIHMINQGKLDTAWTKTVSEVIDQEHSLICLLIDIGGNCNIDAKTMLWTAAAAIKVCDIFEKAGKSVKIITGASATRTCVNGYDMSVTCCIKDYNYHLSVERLAAMCHIGFYRSACFICKTLSSLPVNYNLGHSETLRKFTPLQIESEIMEGKTKAIFLNRAMSADQAMQSITMAESDMMSNLKG